MAYQGAGDIGFGGLAALGGTGAVFHGLTFSTLTDNDEVEYIIIDVLTKKFEIGRGRKTSSPALSLLRDRVKLSSNGGQKVDFGTTAFLTVYTRHHEDPVIPYALIDHQHSGANSRATSLDYLYVTADSTAQIGKFHYCEKSVASNLILTLPAPSLCAPGDRIEVYNAKSGVNVNIVGTIAVVRTQADVTFESFASLRFDYTNQQWVVVGARGTVNIT
jgi:hypothetical protein